MRLPEYMWERSVYKQLQHGTSGMEFSGNSEGYVELGDYLMVSGSYVTEKGLLPFLQRLMAAGAKPLGMTGTVLLPVFPNGKTDAAMETVLRKRIAELKQESCRFGLDISQLGVYDSSTVCDVTIFLTIMGKKKDGWKSPKELVRPGQDIVMTGYAGLEGMKQLLQRNQEQLSHRFSVAYLMDAERFSHERLPEQECRLADAYHVTAMQAAGEGGVEDALWQLAECADVGLEADLRQIPIRQETIEISDVCGGNPYQMAAGGVFLLTTEQGEELTERLHQEGLPAAVIGSVRQGRERILCFGEERRFIEPYRYDVKLHGTY